VAISLLQIDTPEASVQIPRAAKDLRFFGIKDFHQGVLESNYLAFVA
jgi:hypothetical protein